jgi:hypothetical protein
MTATWIWYSVPSLYRGLKIGSFSFPDDVGFALMQADPYQHRQLLAFGFVPLPGAPPASPMVPQ